MKTRMMLLSLVIVMATSVFALKLSYDKSALFFVSIQNKSEVALIQKNIEAQKGVKNVIVDLRRQNVKVVFDSRDNDLDGLKKAFEDMNKPVKKIEVADPKASSGIKADNPAVRNDTRR